MPHTILCEDEQWTIVRERDESARDHFLYAVRTTGIYCRPGCSSRLPKRENVAFFESPQDARLAGYRACKRCRPDSERTDDPVTDAVVRACRLLESPDAPTNEKLAETVGYSPAHFQREFKRIVGVTPKSYETQVKTKQIGDSLTRGETVTNSVYAAGYGSSSRFYENASESLGMRPNQFRNGARGIEIRFASASSSLGVVLMAVTDLGICSIEIGDDIETLTQQLHNRFSAAEIIAADAELSEIVEQVIAFVERPSGLFPVPLDIQGTAFQRRVWEALQQIPAGTTTTYSRLARLIGKPTAARAVATACAANSLAVAVPCHRVVRTDGSLSGYRWGVERKQTLLDREKSQSDEE